MEKQKSNWKSRSLWFAIALFIASEANVLLKLINQYIWLAGALSACTLYLWSNLQKAKFSKEGFEVEMKTKMAQVQSAPNSGIPG